MAQAMKTMNDLLAGASQTIKKVEAEEIVSGRILSIRKHEALVDLGAAGVGIVPRREIAALKNMNEGDEIVASVIDPEMKDGYVLLSMRKAVKDKSWEEIQEKLESAEIVVITPFDANRGGLLAEYGGIRGFLPVSQLSAEHYPRVGSAEKDEILQRLNALVGKELSVRILNANKKENKLIFSEKEAVKDGLQSRFAEMSVGQVVKGVITGVVDFGAFLNVDGIEGLIHISEISWERVSDPSEHLKAGQEIEAKIIGMEKDRLSLSIKQMTEDPWMIEVSKMKKGDEVEGTVTRITPFGAFIQISPAVEALVHVSEMGEENGDDPEKVFALNERKSFKILEIDAENRKVSLVYQSGKKKK